MGKLKVKTLLPFIIFPLLSYIAFFMWAQSVPGISADSSFALYIGLVMTVYCSVIILCR